VSGAARSGGPDELELFALARRRLPRRIGVLAAVGEERSRDGGSSRQALIRRAAANRQDAVASLEKRYRHEALVTTALRTWTSVEGKYAPRWPTRPASGRARRSVHPGELQLSA
jgi:hypothetical protein